MTGYDGAIGLSHAFDISAQIAAPISGGPGPNGERRITGITGGTVKGPRLSGRVLPGGADYEVIRPDGSSRVEAHYTLEADDGTPIYICNKGIYKAPPSVNDRLDRGQPVAQDEYYFRCTPVFDAPPGQHAWLNDHIFVATCIFTVEAVIIRVFTVD